MTGHNPTDDAAEAREALREIGSAQDRSRTHFFYQMESMPVMVWGGVWLVCNLVAYFRPELSNPVWMLGIAVGSIASMYTGWKFSRNRKPLPPSTGKVILSGIALAVVIIVGISALGIVGGFSGPNQVNALISVLIGISFAALGLHQGLRMTITGVAVIAAVLTGWLFLGDRYELWMGIVGGGTLIAGGYWMSRG